MALEEMNVEEEGEGMTLQNKQMVRTGTMNIALKDVAVSKEGKVKVAGRDEVGRTALERREFRSLLAVPHF